MTNTRNRGGSATFVEPTPVADSIAETITETPVTEAAPDAPAASAPPQADPYADLDVSDGAEAVQYFDVPASIVALVRDAMVTPKFLSTEGKTAEWVKGVTAHIRNARAAAGVARVRVVDAVQGGKRGLKITATAPGDVPADEESAESE